MKLHPTVKTLTTNKELRQYAMKKPVVFFGERMTFGQSLGCFVYMLAIMLIALMAVFIAANLLIQKRSKAQSQSNNENQKLSVDLLQKNYFFKDENGHYWRDFVTHYLELIPFAGGFCPVIVQLPQMSCDQEQAVSLPFIENVTQLVKLISVITGSNEVVFYR